MYSDVVMDHFGSPRNVGEPARYNAKGTAGSPSGGPFFIFYLDIREGQVETAGYRTYGCGPAIAAGSLLTELISGQSLDFVRGIDADRLREGLGGLPLSKRHCADLAVGALQKAIREFSEEEGS